MGGKSVWILGDQLLRSHPALEQTADGSVRIVLVESLEQAQRRPYQRKKLVLLFSAMRHYAEALRGAGYEVDYVRAARAIDGLRQHVAAHEPDALYTMAASSYRGRRFQREYLAGKLGIQVVVIPNSQFLVEEHNPVPDPEPERQYIMEYFYRDMRRHYNVLMTADDEPLGGQWNYDKQNRKPLPQSVSPPADPSFEPDEITRAVMDEVAELSGLSGTVEGFAYAVTHQGAQAAFGNFIAHRLAQFGPYEDALSQRSHSLFHSVLSPYLNIGLLEPRPLIRAAERAYREERAPLNSVEGFVRQILGWREFMYWQYWRQMPELLGKNSWEARRALPAFFWTGETDMACLAHALQRAVTTGYNHHIERLMVIGNFCMLAGLEPAAVNDWFSSLYIDAYDWVMPPNVIGMALNADGGLTATKPYIASANYINKMGDHCQQCTFDHQARHGQEACPYNFLYWNFLLEHESRLRSNPRLGPNVLGLRYLDEADRQAVRADAKVFLDGLRSR